MLCIKGVNIPAGHLGCGDVMRSAHVERADRSAKKDLQKYRPGMKNDDAVVILDIVHPETIILENRHPSAFGTLVPLSSAEKRPFASPGRPKRNTMAYKRTRIAFGRIKEM